MNAHTHSVLSDCGESKCLSTSIYSPISVRHVDAEVGRDDDVFCLQLSLLSLLNPFIIIDYILSRRTLTHGAHHGNQHP